MMNPVDIIVLAVVIVCLILAIRAVCRHRTRGGGCCGSCSGCGAAGFCKKKDGKNV